MRTTVNPFFSNLRPDMVRKPENMTPEQEKQRLKEVSGEFEAVMMDQLMKEMRKAVPKSDLLGREIGQETFNEMLDGEFVRLMVQRGGLGLTQQIYDSLAEKSGVATEKGSSSPVIRR